MLQFWFDELSRARIHRFHIPFEVCDDVPEHGEEPEQENSDVFWFVVNGSQDADDVQQLLKKETPDESVAVTKEETSPPHDRDVGLKVMEGAVVSFDVMVTPTLFVETRVNDPPIPVTVIFEYVPGAVDPVVMVRVPQFA